MSNATITGLKHLFDVTLGHSDELAKMQSVRVPRKRPVVLYKKEVARLIACACNIKHQTTLSVAKTTIQGDSGHHSAAIRKQLYSQTEMKAIPTLAHAKAH